MTTTETGNRGDRRLNLSLAISCLVLLVLLYLFSAGRARHRIGQLEAQLTEISRFTERQEMLRPVLESIRKAREAAGDAPAGGSEATMEEYQPALEEMVRKSGLALIALAPDIPSILSEEGVILVDVTTRGEFSQVRGLLLQLAELPSLQGVERFRVARASEGTGLETQLRLRLAVRADGEGGHEDQ